MMSKEAHLWPVYPTCVYHLIPQHIALHGLRRNPPHRGPAPMDQITPDTLHGRFRLSIAYLPCTFRPSLVSAVRRFFFPTSMALEWQRQPSQPWQVSGPMVPLLPTSEINREREVGPAPHLSLISQKIPFIIWNLFCSPLPLHYSREREREKMEGFLVRSAVAVVLSLGIAARAYLHRSLDRSGAIAGFLVMAIHIAAGYRFKPSTFFGFGFFLEVEGSLLVPLLFQIRRAPAGLLLHLLEAHKNGRGEETEHRRGFQGRRAAELVTFPSLPP